MPTLYPLPSLKHQPLQHNPQRIRPFLAIYIQLSLHPPDMLLRLPPQLLNNTLAILKAALALHISKRIPLDLLIGGLLFEYIDQDLVAWIGADGVDNGEAEFAFCEVFAEAFEGCVAGCGGEVEVVV